MARPSASLIFLRRITPLSKSPRPYPSHSLLRYISPKHHSSPSSATPPPSSLSARMSFLFDQIESIERERSEKHEALQRIRSWSEPKPAEQQQKPEISSDEDQVTGRKTEGLQNKGAGDRSDSSNAEVVHPWPEWAELMTILAKQNYFDHKRKEESEIVHGLGFDGAGVEHDDDDDAALADLSKDFAAVQAACLNFGKDRFDILRSLSRQDIQTLVGYGCPNADRRVVFSAKLLRKHAHIDEGDVCSGCSLRGSCDRAYLATNKEDEARTVDMLRVLFTYSFDPMKGSVTNQSVLQQKSVKTAVRKLLHHIAKLGAVPIDPNLPPPVFKRPPPKPKQPPPTPKRRVGRSDIEMKKGDWLCPKCDFMNFAKNIVCLQCDAKRPKRQLLPGEWECPQCNFLNYRRNIACFRCDCKRPPPEDYPERRMEENFGHVRNGEKITRREEVSNAWNFNFDDDESDGADVESFEQADGNGRDPSSRIRGQNGRFPIDCQGEDRNPATDFDDSDVDSYEIDSDSNLLRCKTSADNFDSGDDHENRLLSDDDDDDDGDDERSRPWSERSSRFSRRRSASSGSEAVFDFKHKKESDLAAEIGTGKRKNGTGRRKKASPNYDSDVSSSGSEPEDYGSRSRTRSTRNKPRPASGSWDDDLDDPPPGSRRGGGSQSFRLRAPRRAGFSNPSPGRRRSDPDFGEFRNSRRVIER